MPSPTEISVSQLARLIGQANAPTIVDVRTDSDCAEDPRIIPGSLRRNAQDAANWACDLAGGYATKASRPRRYPAGLKAGAPALCHW